MALAAAPFALAACVTTAPKPTDAPNEPPKPIGINADPTCADAADRSKLGEFLAKARASATNPNGECVAILAGKSIKGSKLVDTSKPTASFVGRVSAPSCENTGIQAQAAAQFSKEAERAYAVALVDCKRETQIAENQLTRIVSGVVAQAARSNGISTKAIIVEVTAPESFSASGVFHSLKSQFHINTPNLPTAEGIGNRVGKAAGAAADRNIREATGGFLQKLLPK